MTKGTFGEHLKREREMRGVSLEEICAATRIGTRFLEALENEQWDRLPGGVFNRGFVRAVARFLGLDEDNLLAEYALAANDRAGPAEWGASRSLGKIPEEIGTRRRPWVLALVLLFVLLAGGWYAWHRYAARRAARASAAGKGQATYQSFGSSPGSSGATDPANLAGRPVSPEGSAQLSTSVTSFALAGQRPATLELKIEAGKRTVVTVVADGKSVFAGRMAARQSQRFQAQEKFEISVRNASALLLELNGQTLAPLGPPGWPAKATLTRNDLKKPPGGPD